MPQWEGSDRRSRLPPDWGRRRARILRRDGHQCTVRDPSTDVRCPEPASDVDHVRAGDDHEDTNLRSICSWHHNKKSGAEGAAARAANWRRNDKKFRRTESHPGVL